MQLEFAETDSEDNTLGKENKKAGASWEKLHEQSYLANLIFEINLSR